MDSKPDDNNVEFMADEDVAILVNVDVTRLLSRAEAPMPGSSTTVTPYAPCPAPPTPPRLARLPALLSVPLR
jgi:hypothetical protein